MKGRQRCPGCGRRLVRIVYGYPSPELMEKARRGEIVIGGCMPLDKEWGCPRCDSAALFPEEGDAIMRSLESLE